MRCVRRLFLYADFHTNENFFKENLQHWLVGLDISYKQLNRIMITRNSVLVNYNLENKYYHFSVLRTVYIQDTLVQYVRVYSLSQINW